MKYKELLEKLNKMPVERMEDDVVICLDICEEAAPIKDLVAIQEFHYMSDVFDVGHYVLTADV